MTAATPPLADGTPGYSREYVAARERLILGAIEALDHEARVLMASLVLAGWVMGPTLLTMYQWSAAQPSHPNEPRLIAPTLRELLDYVQAYEAEK